jgi:metal-responsive CopG/Arc/MetJ family transcriptional regulator
MKTIHINLPDSLCERVKEFAKKEGISVNQFIASAITEKISAFATKDNLEKRALRADEIKYEKALSQGCSILTNFGSNL